MYAVYVVEQNVKVKYHQVMLPQAFFTHTLKKIQNLEEISSELVFRVLTTYLHQSIT